jgi:p-cumate 2,3-dioxygenase ferredoxin component
MSDGKLRVRLCAVDDIEEGAMLQVTPPGFPVLTVYRVGESEFYCTDDTCTHGSASLSEEGDLQGYIVECNRHGGKFDIRNGQPCGLPCIEPLQTFRVVVEGGEVFIEV